MIFPKKGKKRAKYVKKGQKKGKTFENLGKSVQNFKIFWKRAGDCAGFPTGAENIGGELVKIWWGRGGRGGGGGLSQYMGEAWGA